MSDAYYESALLRLRRVVSYLTLLYEKSITEHDLTPVQFEVLLYLDSFQPCGVSDVAGFMVVDKSTSSRVLRGIQDRGFIQIERDTADRRRRKVSLTTKGRNIIDSRKKDWLEIESDIRKRYDVAIEHLEQN
jgi:DNA-binding MarR family transcriptional regulator